jgi:hypothetical protein
MVVEDHGFLLTAGFLRRTNDCYVKTRGLRTHDLHVFTFLFWSFFVSLLLCKVLSSVQ